MSVSTDRRAPAPPSPAAIAEIWDPYATLAEAVPDPERHLAAALDLADEPVYFLAVCNDPAHARRIIGALSQARTVREFRLTRPTNDLVGELQRLGPATPGTPTLVTGIELSVRGDRDPHQAPVIARLNQGRDALRTILPGPLVLFVPEYVYQAIATGAPDFFNGRSDVFHLVDSPDDVRAVVRDLETVATPADDDFGPDEAMSPKWVAHFEGLIKESLSTGDGDKATPEVDERTRSKPAWLQQPGAAGSRLMHTFQELVQRPADRTDAHAEAVVGVTLAEWCLRSAGVDDALIDFHKSQGSTTSPAATRAQLRVARHSRWAAWVSERVKVSCRERPESFDFWVRALMLLGRALQRLDKDYEAMTQFQIVRHQLALRGEAGSPTHVRSLIRIAECGLSTRQLLPTRRNLREVRRLAGQLPDPDRYLLPITTLEMRTAEAQGAAHEARSLTGDVLQLAKRVHGRNSRGYVNLAREVAETLERLGEHSTAFHIRREIWSTLCTHPGGEHRPEVRAEARAIAALLRAKGDPDAAQEWDTGGATGSSSALAGSAVAGSS
jgi:hypothetical protein